MSKHSLYDYEPDLFKVYDFKKTRLGPNIDSGCVIADLTDILYDCCISVGITKEDKFICEFKDKYSENKIDYYAFDGTIDDAPLEIKQIATFIRKNVGPINSNSVTNMFDLIDKYTNIFIKMDIEGSEWEWLKCLDTKKLNNISQIVFELHGITDVSWHNNFTFNNFNTSIQDKLDCLKMLSETHVLIHAHGNNADKITINGIPNVLEVTYLHKKHFNGTYNLNTTPLPDINLDFPNEINIPEVDLNFPPFVNETRQNPFLIDVEDKLTYDMNEYNLIQKVLNEKNVYNLITELYTDQNKFYTLDDFKFRINRGFYQKIIKNDSMPIKKLYKIGNCDNNKNCFVCCTPFKHFDDNISRLTASNKILESLKNVGYNGHLILLNGGFPNPTGKEMKYVGVPYCFKIFMMLEAYIKLGFERVIWLDANCYAINNPEPLFECLSRKDTLLRLRYGNNNYNAMSFQKTIKLLNYLNKNNLYDAPYIETIVFGLNMASDRVKLFVEDYYKMVDLGWPFFSIFPEEIVYTSLFNKECYKSLVHNDDIQSKLYIHEKYLNETDAINNGYYFHHKKYANTPVIQNTNFIITFKNISGRFGNKLIVYLMCKLFTHLYGHKYVSFDQYAGKDYCIINEENIDEYLEKGAINSDIFLDDLFQKSKYFVKYRKELMELIYSENNDDYVISDKDKMFIKNYLINSKHNINLNSEDVVMSLRLDDFNQLSSKTSDVIPPQYYMDILSKTHIKGRLYIVCDKLRYDWERKYVEYFNRWNPILIQNNLENDIALMRDCNTLIHSNSTLCWIISFLSNKEKRIIPFTPKIYINQNQLLEKISENDVLNYVNPLTHKEIDNLNVNSNNSIFPFSFYIPDECVVDKIPEKTTLLASLIPGDLSTYIFKGREKEYNEMYRSSRFAITKKKGGWDCLRHYEILMNGCIPLFENLDSCPKDTMTTYPKHLNDEAYNLYNNWVENDEYIEKYNILCNKFLEHTRQFCTTTAQVKYFLSKIKNGDNIKNILLITTHAGINYNRESLWIGLKRYCKSIDGVAVEYEKIPYLYDDTTNTNDFTLTKRLSANDYISISEEELKEKVRSNYWDLIIYGKVGPDEFCTFPYFDLVKQYYNKDKIAFLYGGDEIFSLKNRSQYECHINMHNVAIYYKPYADYLNYYKHFGYCFVRELEI